MLLLHTPTYAKSVPRGRSEDEVGQGLNSKPDGLGGPPHPVIVTIRDNKDSIRVLLYSAYTTITVWGVLITDGSNFMIVQAFRLLDSSHEAPNPEPERVGQWQL